LNLKNDDAMSILAGLALSTFIIFIYFSLIHRFYFFVSFYLLPLSIFPIVLIFTRQAELMGKIYISEARSVMQVLYKSTLAIGEKRNE